MLRYIKVWVGEVLESEEVHCGTWRRQCPMRKAKRNGTWTFSFLPNIPVAPDPVSRGSNWALLHKLSLGSDPGCPVTPGLSDRVCPSLLA